MADPTTPQATATTTPQSPSATSPAEQTLGDQILSRLDALEKAVSEFQKAPASGGLSDHEAQRLKELLQKWFPMDTPF